MGNCVSAVNDLIKNLLVRNKIISESHVQQNKNRVTHFKYLL